MTEYIIRAADWAIDINGDTLYKGCEEIVRCRDCEYFDNDSEHGAWCNWFMRSLHDDYDGFCAWASKREGAES